MPAAQIITPNQFELESLTGSARPTMAEVLAAADAARASGPETVLVTSVVHDDAAAGHDRHGRRRRQTGPGR